MIDFWSIVIWQHLAFWKMFRLAVLSVLLVGASAMSFEEASAIILEEVASYSSAKTLCEDNTCCTMNIKEKCSISAFAKDQTTMVLPGGETRCIYSHSSPFAFQVIYFQFVFSFINWCFIFKGYSWRQWQSSVLLAGRRSLLGWNLDQTWFLHFRLSSCQTTRYLRSH